MKPLLVIAEKLKNHAMWFGRVLGQIVCFLFYYLVLGPYSLVFRLLKPDPLEIKPTEETKDTYWHRLPANRDRSGRPY